MTSGLKRTWRVSHMLIEDEGILLQMGERANRERREEYARSMLHSGYGSSVLM